jgi:ribosome-associated protein
MKKANSKKLPPVLEDDDEISKSQRKRDMHALQVLGKELVNLSKEHFSKLDLPEELYDAISEARNIRSHGALKRQLQYIGKRMRAVDADQIREQIDTIAGQSAQAVASLHHIERWRERLLENGDAALSELMADFADVDRQSVRQLVRNVKKELANNKPPKSTRLLFKYLRDLMGED